MCRMLASRKSSLMRRVVEEVLGRCFTRKMYWKSCREYVWWCGIRKCFYVFVNLKAEMEADLVLSCKLRSVWGCSEGDCKADDVLWDGKGYWNEKESIGPCGTVGTCRSTLKRQQARWSVEHLWGYQYMFCCQVSAWSFCRSYWIIEKREACGSPTWLVWGVWQLCGSVWCGEVH